MADLIQVEGVLVEAREMLALWHKIAPATLRATWRISGNLRPPVLWRQPADKFIKSAPDQQLLSLTNRARTHYWNEAERGGTVKQRMARRRRRAVALHYYRMGRTELLRRGYTKAVLP